MKIDHLLQLFIAISTAREGQLNIVKIGGLLTELIDLMGCRYVTTNVAVLTLLRNLCGLKENKPYFLTDGMAHPLNSRFTSGTDKGIDFFKASTSPRTLHKSSLGSAI